jgi:hypothetical protein
MYSKEFQSIDNDEGRKVSGRQTFEVTMITAQHVQDFLDARRTAFANPEALRDARQILLEGHRTEVLSHFELRLQTDVEEERCVVLSALAVLYHSEANDILIRCITDPSPTVRWIVCGCLHEFGDLRSVPALLERLKQDDECQVRGEAASALGRIGVIDTLPDLHQAFMTDLEVDQLGYSTSSQAKEAISTVIQQWVTRQISGCPSKTLQESTRTGQLTGTVTAESIPFDLEGRINHTLRYAHLPFSAYGYGCSTKLNLQSTLIAPFEIEVEYVDPTCTLQRILIYHPIHDCPDVDWAIHTITDVSAMKSPPEP